MNTESTESRGESVRGAVRIVLVAVLCSVVLSLLATIVVLTVVVEETREDLPIASPVTTERSESEGVPPAGEPGIAELRAALERLGDERVGMARTVERHSREIAELKRLLEQSLARSGEVAVLDPERQKQDALKRFTEIKQGERQFAIHEAVHDLAALGDAVVPDIVALLKSASVEDYGQGFSIGGGAVKSYASSRMALIDTLRQIGTPAAKQGLLEAIGSSKSITDYRDLFLLYGRTRDAYMVKGMSSLVPGLLRRLKEGRASDVDQSMLERNLADWIRKHEMTEAVPDLVALVEQSVTDGRYSNDYVAALVDLSPDQAGMVAQRLAGTRDGMDAVRRLVSSHALRSARLAKAAQFYEQVFASVRLPAKTRQTIYFLMPTRLCRDIESSPAQVADARRFLTFLKARLGVETDEKARRALKRNVDRLTREIERAERP